MLLAPIKSFRVCMSHQSDRRIRICISHQSERRFCSLVWEVFKFQRRGVRRERFVNWNHLLEWEMLAFLCFKRVFYRALWEMRYYWTDKRYQITNSKRVAHAVKMMDSCTIEKGGLCTVARSWLLFLHEESERKNFESNIAWGVGELHQTFWFEQFFNGKLCCKIHDLLSVPIIFFWIGLLGAISKWISD